jgi:hypothetical protein
MAKAKQMGVMQRLVLLGIFSPLLILRWVRALWSHGEHKAARG